MSQMDVVQETYQQALDATGTTMKQNEVYMSSLEAKTTALKAEFENIVIGKGGLQDMAKFFVDLGTGALKLINSLGGLKTVLTVVAGVILTVKADVLAKGFINLTTAITNFIPNLTTMIGEFRLAKAETGSFADGLKAASISASTAQLAIGALTAIISIGVMAWSAYQASVEKTKAALEQSRQEYEQYTKSLNDTINRIKSETTNKEELIKINKDLGGTYDEEKQHLVDLNDLRQENIDLLYEEAKAKAESYIAEHGAEGEKAEKYLEDESRALKGRINQLKEELTRGESDYSTMGFFKSVITELEEIEKLKPEDAIKRITKSLNDLDKERVKNNGLTKDQELREKELKRAYDELKEPTENARREADLLAEARKNANQTEQEFVNVNGQAVQSTKKLDESTTELIKKYDLEDEAILSLMQDQELSFDEAVQLLSREKIAATGTVEAVDELSKSTSALVSEINDLASALNEQEKNGSISLETQLKLIDAGYAMALSYDQETGACKLNEEAVKQLVEAKLEMQIANLNIAKSSIVQTLIDEGNAAVTAAGEFLALAKAKNLASQSYFNHSGGRDITDPSLSTSGYGGNAGYLKIDSTESQKQIQALDKQIDALENSLKQVQKGGVKAFNSVGKAAGGAGKAAKSAGKDASDAAKDAKKAIEEEVKALEKKQQQYERVIKWIEKQYDKQIDKIKKEKDEAIKSIEAQIKAKEKQKDKELDAIEAQIKALDKEKDARKEYWDAQIDALKQSNKEKKDALELQEKLDALEKAKNTKVKVYKEGQGFVYDVDQTAVAQAQKALDEYLSEKAYEDELARLEALRDAELKNYEDRINSLEDYKDKVQENYENQIKNLEAYKEQVEAHYDSQIEMYENYKQQFEDMVNAYEEEQDRLLASQLAGINLENNNWMTRLDNLQNFVNNYHALLRQIEDAKARMDAVSNSTPTNVSSGIVSSGGGGGSYSSGVNQNWNPPIQSTPTKTYTTHADILPTVTKQSVAATKKLNTSNSNWQTYQNMPSYARPHAKGIDTIPNDEIAIVGESPNQELVIGSKLNGNLMSLDKGTGVVNAESSKSLAGMLNQLGKYSASGFGSGNGTLNNNINNDSLVINGVTIQGSNIKDPETFVNGLLSLKSKALQRAYAHK